MVAHGLCCQGNTALHYAVSQCNIGIMQVLLDTAVCDVRRQNRAGYTAIMLASLLIIDADAHRDVIRRLFAVGDVNVKSATVCVTACLPAPYQLMITIMMMTRAHSFLRKILANAQLEIPRSAENCRP